MTIVNQLKWQSHRFKQSTNHKTQNTQIQYTNTTFFLHNSLLGSRCSRHATPTFKECASASFLEELVLWFNIQWFSCLIVAWFSSQTLSTPFPDCYSLRLFVLVTPSRLVASPLDYWLIYKTTIILLDYLPWLICKNRFVIPLLQTPTPIIQLHTYTYIIRYLFATPPLDYSFKFSRLHTNVYIPP